MKSVQNKKSWLGLAAYITIIIVMIKLIAGFSWPWLWVLSPLLAVLAVSVILMGIIYFVRYLDPDMTSEGEEQAFDDFDRSFRP